MRARILLLLLLIAVQDTARACVPTHNDAEGMPSVSPCASCNPADFTVTNGKRDPQYDLEIRTAGPDDEFDIPEGCTYVYVYFYGLKTLGMEALIGGEVVFSVDPDFDIYGWFSCVDGSWEVDSIMTRFVFPAYVFMFACDLCGVLDALPLSL